MKFFLLVTLLYSLMLAGCNPVGTQSNAEQDITEDITEDITAPQSGELTAREVFKDTNNTSEIVVASEELAARQYVLLSEPWKKYFRSAPKLLILNSPTKGIQALLDQEQALIKMVLDSSGNVRESSEYVELEERLDELKTMIPDAETASGYVPGRSRSYSYVSGNTVYTRRGGSHYYDGHYYRTFREKNKSSSPELVRSVQSLVHNSTIELTDLDQRIDALQRLISQWSRRTSEMGTGGTSGIMREANEAYLSVLRDFTKNFTELRSEVRQVEKKQAQIAQNKSKVLEDWRVFEDNRLGVLQDYVLSNAVSLSEANDDQTFSMPALKPGENFLLICQIGERDLFFEVSLDRSKQHPFVIVDVTPQ